MSNVDLDITLETGQLNVELDLGQTYKGVPVIEQTGDATISPNVWNVWKTTGQNLAITKGTANSGIVNNYLIRFTVDQSIQVAFIGFDLVWYGGSVPTWNGGSTYEISIIDNLALWSEFTPAE